VDVTLADMADGGSRVAQAQSVERVDVWDDPAMQAAYDNTHAAYTAEDPDDPLPTAPEVIAMARSRETSRAYEFWLMHDGDTPVATYRLDLPLLDNLDLAELSLAVTPEHQHRGHGQALLGRALERIAEHGRHQVICGVNEPIDGSENRAMRFAAAAGATRSLGEMRRTLDLRALDRARLAALRAEAEAAAGGYQLVGWTGPCPDELAEGYAALISRMSTDAPMGGLDIEPEQWDVARLRARDEVISSQGRLPVVTAARKGDNGPLVAFSDLVTTRHDPANAFQWDTLVLTEHRGHRLGALVKVANLERLLTEAPDALRMHTWNADENTYMISINEAMGFAPAQRESAWRLDLPRDADADRPKV
jgi:GNAT superfamily N-acetyltransferase